MNPWLQRFLIAWAAGIVTTGAVVSTAKTPHKLKKKKRKKREDGTLEPVQIGATALKDARLAEDRGLTMPEWRDKVVATGSAVGAKVGSVFKRTPKSPAHADDGVGGAKSPDEVQSADGKTVVQPSRSPNAATRKKRKGAHAKGRRGKKRAEATLWDSAKESFKQTVKETVAEEVKETPVGSALETLKTVGARVKEGATKVGAGAAKAVNRAIEGNSALDVHNDDDGREELDENGIPIPRPPPAPRPVGPSLQERIDKAGAAIEKAVKGLAEGAAKASASSTSSTSTSTSPTIVEPVEPPVPLTEEERAQLEAEKAARDAAKVDVEAGAKAAAQVASEVAGNLGRKMKGGLSAVGSWLQGPGSPDFGKRKRANASGEVVEAIVEATVAATVAATVEATVEAKDASANATVTTSEAPAAAPSDAAPPSDAARPTPPTGVPAPVDAEHAAEDFDDADDGDADFDDAEDDAKHDDPKDKADNDDEEAAQ